MMARVVMAPNLQLPWTSTEEDNRRYFKILGILLIPFLVFSITIPLVNVPLPDREELEKLPPQLARVVLEKKELPTPAPTPTPTPKPEEKKEEKKEEPKETPKATPKPKEPDPVKLIEKAREQAEAEIDQFKDALSDMRDAFDLSEVNADLTQSTGEAAELDRSVITSGAKSKSGGINTANLSRDTGGVAVSGKTTTRVKSKLATGDGSKPKGKLAARERSSRSIEEVRKVIDRNKNAVYAIYNRALRKNPALEGKVKFKLVIESSGKVSSASIVSSDLNDPALERKLLSRIRLINFGKQDVLQTTLNYDMDFLPY